jgi:hypothetical protein
LYANLESGAAGICVYEQTALPGLLQIPGYVRALVVANAAIEPVSGTVEGIVAGREGRQRNLRRPGGPAVDVIVDEGAVLRPAVPADVAKQQVLHLLDVVKGSQPNVTLSVLPTQTRIRDFAVPRCTFFMYAYPDPKDPRVVAIERVISGNVLLAACLTCGDI